MQAVICSTSTVTSKLNAEVVWVRLDHGQIGAGCGSGQGQERE